jgi:hypothetical protein
MIRQLRIEPLVPCRDRLRIAWRILDLGTGLAIDLGLDVDLLKGSG